MTIEALQKCKAFFSLGDLVLDNKTDKQLVAGTLSDLCSRCIRLSKNDYIFTAHQRKNNNTITLERVHIKRASKIIANMMTDRKMESSLS
jgi:hypothetical protein